jgi:hypothetical protein
VTMGIPALVDFEVLLEPVLLGLPLELLPVWAGALVVEAAELLGLAVPPGAATAVTVTT